VTETHDAPFKVRIGLGIPSPGWWKSGFGYALTTMIGHFERSHLSIPEDRRPELVTIVIDGHLPQVRHQIAGTALMEGCTHLLWLDTDMMFPADTLTRLLSHNVDVVGANYPRRTYPHVPTAHYGGGGREGTVWTEDDKRGIEEVKHVGLGVCLMHMRVFEAVDAPYFAFVPSGKEMLSVRGEDVYFCEKLREVGIKTWVDHDISRAVGHIGDETFTLRHSHTARRIEDAEAKAKARAASGIVTEAEAAAAAIAPELENAAVEGADIPAGISAPVAEAAE